MEMNYTINHTDSSALLKLEWNLDGYSSQKSVGIGEFILTLFLVIFYIIIYIYSVLMNYAKAV